jgi:hypothetical protein
MAAEADRLFEEIDQLLTEESCTAIEDEKRRSVHIAIGKAGQLVEMEPNNADAHHILAICWYHHPSKTPERSQQIRHHLNVVLALNPDHQFANQYLGYINFDDGNYSESLSYFERTDFDYFDSLDQKWRTLKARELIIVCKLRLGYASFNLWELRAFVAAYQEQLRLDDANTAWPLELRVCAEWLFERGVQADSPVIDTIMRFFDELGFLKTVKNQRLLDSWNGGRPLPPSR